MFISIHSSSFHFNDKHKASHGSAVHKVCVSLQKVEFGDLNTTMVKFLKIVLQIILKGDKQTVVDVFYKVGDLLNQFYHVYCQNCHYRILAISSTEFQPTCQHICANWYLNECYYIFSRTILSYTRYCAPAVTRFYWATLD